MATVILHKEKAENAVKTGNTVLLDAERTLRTLQGMQLKYLAKVVPPIDIYTPYNVP